MDRLDPSAIRARFPALSRTLDGRRCVFADAPGGTQVPETVIEAMAAYLRTSNANVHGAFVTSIETDHLIEEAHRAGSDLLGCHADEIVFGPNATTLLFALSRSIARTLGPGDEIVVTRLDHDADIRPWLMVAEDTGTTVRWVDIRDDDVTIDRGSFQDTLTDRTKVVAFTLASNAVGTVTPAAELARAAHDAGALVVCDGVHVAQHRLLDVHAIGADVVVCSPYKIFGPHLGILFGRRELLESWRPYKVRPASEDLPYRWETGTQNHEGFAGFVAAVDYLADVGRMYGNPSGTRRRDAVGAAFEAIGAHEATLSRRSSTISACTASPSQTGWRSGLRRSPSDWATSTRWKRRSSSGSGGSSCGTATTTPSSSWSGWASRSRAGPSGWGSATTTRPRRSTGSSRSLPHWRERPGAVRPISAGRRAGRMAGPSHRT